MNNIKRKTRKVSSRLLKVFKYYKRINYFRNIPDYCDRDICVITSEIIAKTFEALSAKSEINKVDTISLFKHCFGDKKIVPIFSCYLSLDK